MKSRARIVAMMNYHNHDEILYILHYYTMFDYLQLPQQTNQIQKTGYDHCFSERNLLRGLSDKPRSRFRSEKQ